MNVMQLSNYSMLCFVSNVCEVMFVKVAASKIKEPLLS
jgi:hypothetical protein